MVKVYSLILMVGLIIGVGSAVINLNYPNYKPTAEIVKFMRGY